MKTRGFLLVQTSWECWGLASPIWAGTKDQTMPPAPVCKLRLHHLLSFCFCFWRIIEDLSRRAVLVSPELSGYAPANTNRLSWAFQVTAQPQQSRMETFPLLGSPPWGAECSRVVPTHEWELLPFPTTPHPFLRLPCPPPARLCSSAEAVCEQTNEILCF